METLDDSNGSTKNSDEKTEDAELENVRLDFNTSEVMLQFYLINPTILFLGN